MPTIFIDGYKFRFYSSDINEPIHAHVIRGDNVANNEAETLVKAKGARFDGNILYITLSDEREISLPIDRMSWLKWLANATSEQRAKWTLTRRFCNLLGGVG